MSSPTVIVWHITVRDRHDRRKILCRATLRDIPVYPSTEAARRADQRERRDWQRFDPLGMSPNVTTLHGVTYEPLANWIEPPNEVEIGTNPDLQPGWMEDVRGEPR